jgi:hypothetical protein
MKILFSCTLICILCRGPVFASENEAPGGRPATRTPQQLAQLIASVKPWSSTGRYNESDWEHIVQVAAIFQSTDHNLAAEGFEIFNLQNTNNFHNDYLEGSKAFLLLRVMFDLPEHGKGRPGGPGWLTERRDLNSDGTVNFAWPVVWREGQPSLASEYIGYEGFSYSPKSDYLVLSSHFKKRDLGAFSRKEKRSP